MGLHSQKKAAHPSGTQITKAFSQLDTSIPARWTVSDQGANRSLRPPAPPPAAAADDQVW